MTPSPDNTLIDRMLEASGYHEGYDTERMTDAARVMLEEILALEDDMRVPGGGIGVIMPDAVKAWAKENGLE